MTYEESLRERLAELHRLYQRAAKPIIDELARLESMKPPKPMIIILDEAGSITQDVVDKLLEAANP